MPSGIKNLSFERSASEHRSAVWKVEVFVSDMGTGSTNAALYSSELATRLALALLIWSARMPGLSEAEFLRTIVDPEKLKTVLGLIGCISEPPPL